MAEHPSQPLPPGGGGPTGPVPGAGSGGGATIPVRRPGAPAAGATRTTPGVGGTRRGSMGGKVVIIGIALAVLAVILMNVHVETVRRQARGGEFLVYRLETRVQPGDTLREGDLRPVRTPGDFRDAFENAIDDAGLRARIGEPFRRPAERGAVLTYDLFIDPEEGNIDRLISRELRLVALPVNSRTLPGNLRPGMFVDIEAPFAKPGGGLEVLPVMEYVKVLAVGRRSVVDERTGDTGQPTNYSTISIEVAPEQATQLSMIQTAAMGEFQLHLRNPADTSQPKIPTGGINPDVISLIETRYPTPETSRR